MKIPKEQIFVFIIGLFLLSYLLEAIVDPLTLKLATPYDYFSPLHFGKYPFTTTTVIIRGLSIFLTPLFLLSFIPKSYFAKVGLLLVVSSLAQLYALQEVASGTTLIPLEWSLSLSVAGAFLILPIVFIIIQGIVDKFKSNVTLEDLDDDETENEQ